MLTCRNGHTREAGKKCPQCRSDINKRDYQKNQTKRQAAQIDRNRIDRVAALEAYGNACSCCGEKRYEFLAIDHIDGSGGAHRRALFGRNAGGAAFYRWLRVNGYPAGFRVLCHNCNMAIGLYHVCPHEVERLR